MNASAPLSASWCPHGDSNPGFHTPEGWDAPARTPLALEPVPPHRVRAVELPSGRLLSLGALLVALNPVEEAIASVPIELRFGISLALVAVLGLLMWLDRRAVG